MNIHKIRKNKWFFATCLIVVLNSCGLSVYAQSDFGTISTGAPFLLIGTDARAGGIGDSGGASPADANSMHWNSAKYAFCESNAGAAVNYSPWMRSVGVDDVNLVNVSGYWKIDDRNKLLLHLLTFQWVN